MVMPAPSLNLPPAPSPWLLILIASQAACMGQHCAAGDNRTCRSPVVIIQLREVRGGILSAAQGVADGNEPVEEARVKLHAHGRGVVQLANGGLRGRETRVGEGRTRWANLSRASGPPAWTAHCSTLQQSLPWAAHLSNGAALEGHGLGGGGGAVHGGVRLAGTEGDGIVAAADAGGLHMKQMAEQTGSDYASPLVALPYAVKSAPAGSGGQREGLHKRLHAPGSWWCGSWKRWWMWWS